MDPNFVDANEAPYAGPPFTRQGPPPKLGVLRSVVLALMAAVAAVEIVLLSGVFMLGAFPSGIFGGFQGTAGYGGAAGAAPGGNGTAALPVNTAPVNTAPVAGGGETSGNGAAPQAQDTAAGGAGEEGHAIYITRTGERYHYDSNCNGGTYYLSNIEEALSLHLTPCEKCVK